MNTKRAVINSFCSDSFLIFFFSIQPAYILLNTHSHSLSTEPKMLFTRLFTFLAAATMTFALPAPADCPAALKLHETHPHASLCSLAGYTSTKTTAGKGKSGKIAA
jgi:hypothetical protein